MMMMMMGWWLWSSCDGDDDDDSCLGEWLRSHDKCPICRQPIRPGAQAPPPPPPRGPCDTTATAGDTDTYNNGLVGMIRSHGSSGGSSVYFS